MKIRSLLLTVLIFLFGFLLIIMPDVGREGVTNGILLCGRVIIPSLFPFTMCVIFILNSAVINQLKFLSPVTKKLLGLNYYEFSLFLLSLVGGYPIGAKLLDEAVKNKVILPEKAEVMLRCCINAGPAFIISAVGKTVFGSPKIGTLLFCTHITASLIICIFSAKKSTAEPTYPDNPPPSFADNFVQSAATASSSLISICGFVILFSAINPYLLYFAKKIPILKIFALLLEITNALSSVRNIYLISFLLGFSGVCIWCQVMSAFKSVKINYVKFAVFRITHGILSSLLTFLSIRIFGISIPAVSHTLSYKPFYSTPAVAISLFVLAIVFAVSLTSKKINCKLSEDVI